MQSNMKLDGVKMDYFLNKSNIRFSRKLLNSASLKYWVLGINTVIGSSWNYLFIVRELISSNSNTK